MRVVDDNGEMLGILSRDEAIKIAQKKGLDLVEVSPGVEPPVCKMLDYGKFKFQQKRKHQENKKKQKVVHLKEIKLRPTIDKHDYEVKMRAIRKFIEGGDKVKISLRFRGREITHQDIGMNLMHRIVEDISDIGKAELAPKMDGRQIIMILAGK